MSTRAAGICCAVPLWHIRGSVLPRTMAIKSGRAGINTQADLSLCTWGLPELSAEISAVPINKDQKITMPIQFLNTQHKRKITGLRHFSFYFPSNEKHAEKSNYIKITKQQKSESATLFPFHCPIRVWSWLQILREKLMISDCCFIAPKVQCLINNCNIRFGKQCSKLINYTPIPHIFKAVCNIGTFSKHPSGTQIDSPFSQPCVIKTQL